MFAAKPRHPVRRYSISVQSQAPLKFPCHCGHVFRLPVEQAASTVQCPKCGRLNDVPALSDLDSLSEDGTVLLKPPTAPTKPTRIAEADRHFGPHRTDRQGNEIDLRNTHDDLANVGVGPDEGEIPLTADDARPVKPKYDPVTGELLRPIKVAKDPAAEEAKNVPLAKRALTYAAGDEAKIVTARRIFFWLFQPTNMVVMLFIFLFYFISNFAVGMFGFMAFSFLGMMPTLYNVPLAFFLMAHYANTVEDNGPESMDELPRPLRNFSPANDMWFPFINMTIALAYCFAPAVICLVKLPGQFQAVTILAAGVGAFFFPAALVTTVAAGTTLNLRPDRVAGVVRESGGQYVLSFFLWLLSLPLFAYSLFDVYLIPLEVRDAHPWIDKVLHRSVVAYPLLFVSIILMHFACWHLGLIYRRHHEHFPWIMQKHVSVRRQQEAAKAAEIRAMRRKPRYVK
jgi:hypothetical protein